LLRVDSATKAIARRHEAGAIERDFRKTWAAIGAVYPRDSFNHILIIRPLGHGLSIEARGTQQAALRTEGDWK
jgi:hypothetical protein